MSLKVRDIRPPSGNVFITHECERIACEHAWERHLWNEGDAYCPKCGSHAKIDEDDMQRKLASETRSADALHRILASAIEEIATLTAERDEARAILDDTQEAIAERLGFIVRAMKAEMERDTAIRERDEWRAIGKTFDATKPDDLITAVHERAATMAATFIDAKRKKYAAYTATRIAAWVGKQEDQDGCGEAMVTGIRNGAWRDASDGE